MEIAAIVPARGGSKGLRRKNLRLLGGQPLVVIAALQAAEIVGRANVYVSTEDYEIKAHALAAGFQVIDRPPGLAQDDSSTLDVLRHAAQTLPHPWLTLFQPTDPFRDLAGIHAELPAFFKSRRSSGFAGHIFEGFFWGASHVHRGELRPVNRGDSRPRRQDKAPFVIEDGTFYITARDNLAGPDWIAARPYLFPGFPGIDIHTERDLALANRLWSDKWLTRR